MKYDDIILECKGDCDVCDVYLECQYQTSSGDEKQHYLDALIERDSKPVQEEVTATVTEPEVETEIDVTAVAEAQVETEAETETEIEVAAEAEVEVAVEEAAEVETPAEEPVQEDLQEVTETPIEEVIEGVTEPDKPEAIETLDEVQEPVEETVAEEPVQEEIQAEPVESDKAVTPISEEEVTAIYAQVFNINNNDESIENVTAIETAEEPEAETAEPDLVQEEPDEVTQEIIADEEIPEVLEEVSEEETQEVVVDNAQEVEPEETAQEEVQAEEAQEEKLTPPTKEQVDEIYAEVFNLKNLQAIEEAEEVQEVALEVAEPVEELPVQEETIVTEEVQEVSVEEVNAVETQEEVQEVSAPDAQAETINVAQQETADEAPFEPVSEPTAEASVAAPAEAPTEPAPVKEVFKLTPPENNDELMANMCAKRARKLIYKPSEALITASFKVLGTDKKNDIGEKIKDILDAEIKQGVKVGYLDKFDGLSSSEIKEEYENDIVYEFADQEFKKTGVIYDGKKIKVYIYDWDGKACHHVGYVDTAEAADFIPYLTNKEEYSFDVCGIITGGKGKRVVKEGNTLKIIKEKGDPIGLDVDIAVIKRKD